ncbi:MAG: TOBE domain-containing protein, partial [Candidatus Rokubacteria bacterium]|nr:TOBE domain-containing protein [Candidatus Rokubacteria bacterium]
RPANRFVAEFIGLANLLPAEVTAPAAADRLLGAALALGDGRRVALRALAPDAAPRVGARVLLSVRPEDVELGPAGAPGEGNRLEGTVASAVYMGDIDAGASGRAFWAADE